QLRGLSIPQGECGEKAFEIAAILFNQAITKFPAAKYNSLPDVSTVVSDAVTHGSIAIAWLDAGAIDSSNPSYRAIHCYFIYQDKPLHSFAIWEAPRVEFYNEVDTRAKIIDSLELFKSNGGIDLHVVPPFQI